MATNFEKNFQIITLHLFLHFLVDILNIEFKVLTVLLQYNHQSIYSFINFFLKFLIFANYFQTINITSYILQQLVSLLQLRFCKTTKTIFSFLQNTDN